MSYGWTIEVKFTITLGFLGETGMPDSDRRHSPGKSMDDWEGVLLYRTIDSLLKKNVNGIPIGAAVHGDRLAAILLPEFVR